MIPFHDHHYSKPYSNSFLKGIVNEIQKHSTIERNTDEDVQTNRHLWEHNSQSLKLFEKVKEILISAILRVIYFFIALIDFLRILYGAIPKFFQQCVLYTTKRRVCFCFFALSFPLFRFRIERPIVYYLQCYLKEYCNRSY